MSEQTGNEQDESYGLRDIARWLTTPAACGLYLTMRDLERIGQSAGISGLPRNRRFAVEQLFRSAALEEDLSSMFDALTAEATRQREAYLACDSPALDTWELRAAETIRRLDELRRESTG